MKYHIFRISFVICMFLLLGLAINSLPGQTQVTLAAPPAQATLQQDNPVATPQDTETPPPTPTPSETASDTNYSRQAVLLVLTLLIILAYLFILLISWNHRLDQTSYLGQLYKDSILKIEKERLLAPLKEQWKDEKFEQEVLNDSQWRQQHRPPLRPSYYYDYDYDYGESDGGSSGGGGPAGPELEKKLLAIKEWEIYRQNILLPEARRRYREKEAELIKKAEKLAKQATNVELGLFEGRGPKFVLGFTALVVIVFAATALGILGILSSEQIGTLLAAIAGYVLGQETAASQSHTDKAKTQTSPQISELAKTTSKTDQPPTISINKPVSSGLVYNTTQSQIEVAGITQDDKKVVEVRWTRTKRGSDKPASYGTATFLDNETTSRNWHIPEFTLPELGDYEISVEAKNASGYVSEPAKITVKYAPPEDSTTNPPRPEAFKVLDASEQRDGSEDENPRRFIDRAKEFIGKIKELISETGGAIDEIRDLLKEIDELRDQLKKMEDGAEEAESGAQSF